jgi:hypothetical protein
MTEQTQEPEWHGVLAFVVGQAGTHGCTSDRRASESKYTIAIVKPWASGMEAPTPPGWKTSSKGRRSANDRADGVERESSGTMLWKPCVVPRRRSYGMTTPHTLTDTAHTTEEPFFNLNRIKTLLSRKGAPLMWPSRNCVVFTCNSEHYDNAGRLQHENPAKFFC